MNTELKLYKLLSEIGQQRIAEIIGITQQEVNRKMNGETGFKLSQLSLLADSGLMLIAGSDDVLISKEKYQSLRTLSREALEREENC